MLFSNFIIYLFIYLFYNFKIYSNKLNSITKQWTLIILNNNYLIILYI